MINRSHILYFIKKYYLYICAVVFIVFFFNKSLDAMDSCRASLTDAGYINDPTTELISEGFNIQYLYSGNYVFTFVGKSEGEKNYCEIVDRYTNTYLGGGTFNKGEGNTSFYLEVPCRCRDVIVRCYSVDGDLKVSECIVEGQGVYSDSQWFKLLCIPLAGIIILGLYKYKKGNGSLILLTVFACIVSFPFFTDNLQYGHDISFHYTRFCGIVEGIREGQFPVRMDSAFYNGAGYIVHMMYPELLLYPFAIMASHSASLLFAFKSIYVVFTFITVYTAYYSYKNIFENNEKAAVIFAVIFTLNPYRLNDIYIRCALGEWIALTFIPLSVAGIYQLIIKNEKKGFLFLTFSATMIFQSHMITAFLVAFFGGIISFFLIAINYKSFFKIKRVVCALATISAIFLLNVWYLIAFWELAKNDLAIVYGDENLFFNSGLYIYEAFMDGTANYENANISGTLTQGQMCIGVGIFLLITTLMYLYIRIKENDSYFGKDVVKNDLFCVVGIIAVFMESVYFPWSEYEECLITKLFIKMQYPWRLQVIVIICFTSLAASTLDKCNIKKCKTACIALMLVLIISATGYSRDYLYYNDDFKENKLSVAVELDKIENVDYIERKYLQNIQLIMDRCLNNIPIVENEDVTISELERNGTKYSFDYENNTGKQVVITVPIFYSGFYKAYIDNIEIDIQKDVASGFSTITLDQGIKKAHIVFEYVEPERYRIADYISFITAFFFIFFIIIMLMRKVLKNG